jgi:hypothetical protein
MNLAHIRANLKKTGYQLSFNVAINKKGNNIRIGVVTRI